MGIIFVPGVENSTTNSKRTLKIVIFSKLGFPSSQGIVGTNPRSSIEVCKKFGCFYLLEHWLVFLWDPMQQSSINLFLVNSGIPYAFPGCQLWSFHCITALVLWDQGREALHDVDICAIVLILCHHFDVQVLSLWSYRWLLHSPKVLFARSQMRPSVFYLWHAGYIDTICFHFHPEVLLTTRDFTRTGLIPPLLHFSKSILLLFF